MHSKDSQDIYIRNLKDAKIQLTSESPKQVVAIQWYDIFGNNNAKGSFYSESRVFFRHILKHMNQIIFLKLNFEIASF